MSVCVRVRGARGYRSRTTRSGELRLLQVVARSRYVPTDPIILSWVRSKNSVSHIFLYIRLRRTERLTVPETLRMATLTKRDVEVCCGARLRC